MSQILPSTLAMVSLASGVLLGACDRSSQARTDDDRADQHGANQEFSELRKGVEETYGVAYPVYAKGSGVVNSEAGATSSRPSLDANGGSDLKSVTLRSFAERAGQLEAELAMLVAKPTGFERTSERDHFDAEAGALSLALNSVKLRISQVQASPVDTFQAARGKLEVQLDEIKGKLALLRSGT